MVTPLITIAVPVYNAANSIAVCLDSLINQTYQNIEIIVVNDGSTDDSIGVIQKYIEIDERIVLINQENLGVSQARNRVLECAHGEWISFVDADDYVAADYIEQLIPQSDDVQMSLCGMIRLSYDGTGTKWDLYVKPKKHSLQVRFLLIDDIMTQINPYALTGPVCKLFKMNIIKKYALRFPTDMNFGEDSVFVFSYLFYLNKIQVVEFWTYYYCSSTNSLTTIADTDAKLLATHRIYDISLNICEKNNIKVPYVVQHHFLDNILQILRYEKRKFIRYKCYNEIKYSLGCWAKVVRKCMPFYFPLFAYMGMWREYDKFTKLIYNRDT